MAVVVCVALNTATLASIGYHVSVRRESLVEVFNASMRLYVSAASYKYAIDEIQFALQCCGHTSYTDWFRFDWQVSSRRCLKPASIAVSPKAFIRARRNNDGLYIGDYVGIDVVSWLRPRILQRSNTRKTRPCCVTLLNLF